MFQEISAQYIDHMGCDLSIANDARVSFAKESSLDENGNLRDSDKSLLKFLARGVSSGDWKATIDATIAEMDGGNTVDALQRVMRWAQSLPTHWAPFAQTSIKIREFMPVFVARQRFKHKIGMVESEVSRRYVSTGIGFLQIDYFRSAAPNKKQGSLDVPLFNSDVLVAEYEAHCDASEALYNRILESGGSPEQARAVLPQSMMVEVVVTGNLYSFAEACNKRSRNDAQLEIRELAAEWDRIIRPLFPHAWAALVD